MVLVSLGRRCAFLQSSKGDEVLQSNLRAKFSSLHWKIDDLCLVWHEK